jgi:hypothetical protein
MAIGEMSSHLFMRAIYHLHLAFHKPFKRRIAKPAGQSEHMFNTLFLQGTRKQCATPYLFWWRHSAALSSIVRNINVS